MKKIEWENPKKKSEAYTYLIKVFKVSKPTVSLAMSFKRNSLEAARMRHVALTQLGAKLLTDEEKSPRTVKILNAKGETVKAIIVEN